VFWFLQRIILSAPCVLVSSAHHLVSSLCFDFFSAAELHAAASWVNNAYKAHCRYLYLVLVQ